MTVGCLISRSSLIIVVIQVLSGFSFVCILTHSNKFHFSGVVVFVKRVGVVQGLSVGMTGRNTVGDIFSLSIKMLFIIFTLLQLTQSHGKC